MSMPPGFAKPSGPDEPKPEWEVELEQDQEMLRVRRWREQQLLKAGFGEFAAFRIAMRFEVPYQRAVGMLRAGATELQITDLLLD